MNKNKFKPKVKIVYGDIYVKVMPDAWMRLDDPKYVINVCKTIMSDIERHVDNIAQNGVSFEVETHEECEHCKYKYEEDHEGMPVCCQEAIDDYEKWKCGN